MKRRQHDWEISKVDWESGCCLGVAILSVYVATMYPTVSGGDAGELLVGACNLGVVHPPGYPLYVLLGHLFIRVFSSQSPAWSVGLLSVICGTICGIFIYLTVDLIIETSKLRNTQRKKHTSDRKAKSRSHSISKSPKEIIWRISWPGVLSALIFSFGHTPWLYNIQAEVFGLNNALVSILFYLGTRYFLFPHDQIAYLGAFVSGLALTNQHTSVFYIFVSVLLTFAFGGRRLVNFYTLAILSICFIAGLSPYFHLYVAALRQVNDSWGDQRTFDGFLRHILRREYGTFQLGPSELGNNPGFVYRLSQYFVHLNDETMYLGGLLSLLGIVWLFSHNRTNNSISFRFCGYNIIFSWLLYVGVFHYLANLEDTALFSGVMARFWPQSMIPICILLGLGFHSILSTSLFSLALRNGMSFTLALALSLLQLSINFRRNDFHSTFMFHEYGRSMLESVPQNALLLVNGDLNNNVVKYIQQCENIRQDVNVIGLQQMSWEWFVPQQRHFFPDIEFPGDKYHPYEDGGFSIEEFLEANYGKHEIYLCGPWKENDESWEASYDILPYGLCERVLRRRDIESVDIKTFLVKSYNAMPHLDRLGNFSDVRHPEDTWERVVFDDVSARNAYLSNYIAFHASTSEDKNLLWLAKTYFDRILFAANAPPLGLSPEQLRAAGVIYGMYSAINRADLESPMRMHTLWKLYLEHNPEDREISILVKDAVNPYTQTRIKFR